jgi:hypothetical protein
MWLLSTVNIVEAHVQQLNRNQHVHPLLEFRQSGWLVETKLA